ETGRCGRSPTRREDALKRRRSMDTQLPPPAALYQLATGHYVSHAIYAAAKLGIADLLGTGPQRCDDLAKATGTHAPALRRVLRLLASAGVFAETEDGRFELTPVGSCLQSGPGSFRPVALLFTSPGVRAAWGDLLHSVRTGEPALNHVFGMGSFEYFAQHPEEAAVFDEAVGAVRILRNCRRAMKAEGKLLIVEGVYPERIDQSVVSRGAAANDVNMLVCTGGRQRAEAEFRALFDAAGFELTRIVPTQAMSSVIEGARA